MVAGGLVRSPVRHDDWECGDARRVDVVSYFVEAVRAVQSISGLPARREAAVRLFSGAVRDELHLSTIPHRKNSPRIAANGFGRNISR
jgi:hypothetical protein